MTDPRTQVAAADLNDAERAIDIAWQDGHASRYSLKLLREECPCAGCRTDREEIKRNPFRVIGPDARPPSFSLADVEPVGTYALRFVWTDGHGSGIYTFDFLRELCPCEVCRSARVTDETPYVHGIFIPSG